MEHGRGVRVFHFLDHSTAVISMWTPGSSPNRWMRTSKNCLMVGSSVVVGFFLQPDLDQRLIGHIAGVGGGLDGFQQVQG